MTSKDVNVGKMEEQLKQWGARLDEIAAKAKTIGADAKAKELERVAELRAKRDVVQGKLAEFKADGGENWQTLKTAVDGAYSDLAVAFKKLVN